MQTTDTLLRLPEVESMVGLKKSKLYSLIREGRFPSPCRLGKRSVRWRSNAVHSWINSLSPAEPEETKP
jgi:prophage regulatory protein